LRQYRANPLKDCVTTMDKKELTKRLAFLCMSDASLDMHKGCVNASFHLTMCKENRDMAEYAISLLKEVNVGYRYSENEKYFRLDSKVHPFLTKLWERIYQDGRRVPSPHDFKLLDWEAVAIMYMCDGNIQVAGKRWYPMINMCKWSYAELCWVKVQFKEKLNLDINIYKCGKYYRVGVPAHHCDYFFDKVEPFMLDSFKYKLASERETPNKG
jgi:hypothetical protein